MEGPVIATLADALSWACIVTGSAFAIVGAIGIIRLPDVFARMHGAGLIDTMGAGLILLGLAIQAGFTLITVKLLLILLFLLFTSPTTTHALARAAQIGGVIPMVKQETDGEDKPSPNSST